MSCPRALHRFAPFLGDVGINTGYEATKAGIQGGDVGQAAGAGAVGCGIGHGVAAHFGEQLAISEPLCMLRGDASCELIFKVWSPRA